MPGLKRTRCEDCGDGFASNTAKKRHKFSCKMKGRFEDKREDIHVPVSDEYSTDEDEIYLNEEEIEDLVSTFKSKHDQSDNYVKTGARGFARALVTWTCVFLCLWQSAFYISSAAMSMLLQYAHALLSVAATHSSLISMVLPLFPTSIYMLHKILKLDKNNFVHYVVCPSCHSIYQYAECIMHVEGEVVSRTCPFVSQPNHPLAHHRRPCSMKLLRTIKLPSGKTKLIPHKNYYYKSIEDTLRELTSRQGFKEQCELWRKRHTNPSTLYDVYDGKIWQEFNEFFSTFGNYGLMLNVDWFQPFKHVQYSVGVIYMVILNLPREERFKRENIILVGVIPHMKKEPPTNTFIQPLVDELQTAWSVGFTFGSGLTKRVQRFALVCIGCDIPACRKLCGFLGHSAIKGCSKCHKEFPGAIGCRDYSGFDRNLWNPRSHGEHIQRVRQISKCSTITDRKLKERQFGARYSVLSELPYIDLVRMSIIDPMHNLFLGTAKHMLRVWKDTGVLSEKTFNDIQERVDSVECPSDIGRIPRKIVSGFSGFTADQFKTWTTLFSVYALKGVISDKHLNCWRYFVLACRLLSCRAITRDQIKLADSYLIKFCKTFEILYGKERITPNMHLHGHLADSLFDFGPVYSFWLFSFERFNGMMGDVCTNMKNIELQLMRRFLCHSQLLGLQLEDDHNVAETLQPVLDRLFPRAKAGTLNLSSNLFELHIMASRLLDMSILDWSNVDIYQYSKYKICGLSVSEEINLLSMYRSIYKVEKINILPSYKLIKSLILGKEMFGSLNHRTSRSSVINAYWTDNDGHIDWGVHPRPGQIVHFMYHTVRVENREISHLLAHVRWFKEMPPSLKNHYGQPIEVWNRDGFVDPGPSSFMPVQRIKVKMIQFRGQIENKTVDLFCSREQFAYT